MNTTLPCAPEPPHAGYTRFAEKTYTQKQDRTDTLWYIMYTHTHTVTRTWVCILWLVDDIWHTCAIIKSLLLATGEHFKEAARRTKFLPTDRPKCNSTQFQTAMKKGDSNLAWHAQHRQNDLFLQFGQFWLCWFVASCSHLAHTWRLDATLSQGATLDLIWLDNLPVFDFY